MRVKLSYFKMSGKWKYDGEFTVPDHLSMNEIWIMVTSYRDHDRLPGLDSGVWEGPILVDVPMHEHNHPHLVMP